LPADTAVALGAFLSHRGVTTPMLVFLVTWTANSAGAIGVYLATRRFGTAFAEGPIGRRLITPGAVAAIEREYARFGTAGIFLARFLPGIRAVVPAFAGLVRLGPARAILPVVLASAVWYGAITAAAARLGAEWETISRWLGDVNRTLGLIALAVVAVGVILVVRRRREGRRLLWEKLKVALEHEASGPHTERDPALRAAAALVLELVYSDRVLQEDERRLVEAHLIDRWDLAPPRASEEEFRSQSERLLAGYGLGDRLDLLHRMWQAAMREGPPGHLEKRLLERAATVLGIEQTQAEQVARESWPGYGPREES